MMTYENITMIISVIALMISLISLIFSKINMIKVEKIYYGQSEISIRNSISNAKIRLTDILSNANTNQNEYTRQCIKVAIEELLNAYEEACAKYLDAKIDRKRFRKTYSAEIRNIIESKKFSKYFEFGSKYEAVKKVYNEWFNLEK